ncbi:BON domain-containing protein [Cupriavidus sp. 30B13]|uniref:BON domain-containing protein n=1 Tax=Cupriavidus sp. 30B13 TaxID=3384241 RepID=UPI003B906683
MNTTTTLRTLCLAAMLAVAGAAQAATDTGTSMSNTTDNAKQKISDGTLTTKVKAELLAAKGLKSTGIHVKTKDGVVSLDGKVPSEDQRTLAVQTARNVDGVASVSDSLQVVAK